jgi:hypothetical protein
LDLVIDVNTGLWLFACESPLFNSIFPFSTSTIVSGTIYAFRLKNYGGWAMEPVAIGILQDPIGDIILKTPRFGDDPIPESVAVDDNVSLWD